MVKKTGLFILFLIWATTICQGQSSKLADGQWYKLQVTENNMYKLSATDLASLGVDVTSIDPRNIKIYGYPGGMLPQANAIPRPVDLLENAILVTGESDGSFDAGDLVIFYGEGPDDFSYDYQGKLNYSKNGYSRTNYYFLTIDNTPGLRVGTKENLGNNFPVINRFNGFNYYEETRNNLLISGRNWYGEKFETTTTYSFPVTTTGISPGSTIRLGSKVMAQSFAASTFTLTLNGINLGTQEVESIPNYNQPQFRYSIKGKEKYDEFELSSNSLTDRNNLTLTYSYERNNSGRSVGYLDFFSIEYLSPLTWSGQPLFFRSLESLSNTSSTFEIGNAVNTLEVWDISQPETPLKQATSLSQNKLSFGINTSDLKEFVVFDPANLPTPTIVGQMANQNLHGMAVPELLIISHPDFLNEANRLANLRKTEDGLSVSVVTPQQIYNEFSSGRQDVSALRDFARHLYQKSSDFKYLLLFGRGSYDYLDVLANNTNYIPIYESRNSLHPLFTYGSDDFYGFLEDEEGEWEESFGGEHTLDIGIGRIPVTTTDEAKAVVDKLYRYATDKRSYGDWKNKVVFVADDGDLNLHQRQADLITQYVDTTFKAFLPEKLFLDNYKQLSRPGGEISPACTEALNNAVDQGALIINYTGHGGEIGWMQEQVLNTVTIREWSNKNRLPLFVSATCEFSRHDDPRIISGGEYVLTNPKGGGIGIVSTCRPVSSSSNFELNKALFSIIFKKVNGQHLRLGDVFKLTKNNPNVNSIGNRNFSLLGDPSLKLNYPEKTISISAIRSNGLLKDTLSALSSVTIEGEILEANGTLSGNFNGTLDLIVFDKETAQVTLGNENPPYNYYDKENVIFRGKASVINGKFSSEFIVPKNISYYFDKGKISMYAVNDNKTTDANGAEFVTIGGASNANVLSDLIGPEITVFLGDSTNSSYRDAASNTDLVLRLADESGINITGFGIGNSIQAVLDDSITFILNDYYQATTDTYQLGWVTFPLKNLTKGSHTLRIKAWDTFNNSSEQTIEFTVFDPNKVNISKLLNYPNPFSEVTNFTFQHNRSGEDLEVTLTITDRMGKEVENFEFFIEDSPANVNLGQWEGTNKFGEKIQAGLYLIRLTVRSIKDGAYESRYERLILIK